jgi:dethiobiotin synthase
VRGIFVAGTDTNVGKTVVSAALMAAAGPHLRYWKPVQTGLDAGDDDTRMVLSLAGLEASRVLDEGARLGAPSSPHHAAEVAGRPLEWRALPSLAMAQDTAATRWVVEGAGGLLVPLDRESLLPALIRALGLPLLVVASTRLGTIHHTLATLRAAASEGLETLGVVMSGPYDPSAWTGLAAHAEVPILGHIPPLQLEPGAVRRAGLGLLEGAPALRSALRVAAS